VVRQVNSGKREVKKIAQKNGGEALLEFLKPHLKDKIN